ncbi:hypothetical protein BOTBODRAFT_545322 [Botryobasidium botryosum FD-172 SS1]|uniref:JmjC domain-containing protein n=1 Tax=Botryobasidium botryosum (strain FD-172 SS1) TaxID=930990 RepID=A0A067N2H5_BOTB1|nr:hypothetical protein BOTBODRAFT_545322 [Botryobasidium botryosum FD-172 SS1]
MAIRGIFSSPLSSATPSPMTDPAPLPESDIPLGFLSTRGWVLEELVQSSPNFCHVERISALDPSGIIGDKVLENETSGLPLIIQDWHRTKEWDSHMWSLDWLLEHFDAEKLITARNVRARVDYEMTLPDLVEKCCQTSMFASPNERERFYGKDLPCPPEWNQALDMLPSGLRPLGSNDLFANLDSKVYQECPETLMIYLGIGDTFTPAHKDLCASYGQNLMTYTAPLRPHDPESPTDPSANPASAFWFLTSSADSIECSQYFNTLGAELDAETHIVTLDELRRAPFKVYICEQKLGDLVLVPPMSCHQVVNHGGITIKTSWSRMPLASLTPALHLELPIYRSL